MAAPPVQGPPSLPPRVPRSAPRPFPTYQTPAVRRAKKVAVPRIPLHPEDPLFGRFIHAVINKERVRIDYVMGLAANMPVRITTPVSPLQRRYGQETFIEGIAAAITPRTLTIFLDGGPIMHLPRTWVVGFVFFGDPPNAADAAMLPLVAKLVTPNRELAQAPPARPPTTLLKPTMVS